MSGGRDKRDRDEAAPTHVPHPERCTPYCTAADHTTPRALVTMHFPLDMHCAAEIMAAVARAYPRAVVGENGAILEGPVPA